MAAVIWSVYLFFILDLSSHNEDLSRLKNEISFYENQHIELRKMIVFVDTAEDSIEKTKGFFLTNDEGEIVRLIKKIESFGKEADVSLQISGLSVLERDGNKFLSADVSIVGDWISVNNTIAMIELIPHRVLITELQLKEEGETWLSSLKVNILMKD